MKSRHVIVSLKDLKEEVTIQMYQLMNRYYDNLHKNKFLTDLYQKDGVLLVYDQNDVLSGFTTYTIFEAVFRREKIKFLYSGDTVMSEEFWGHMTTPKTFMSLIQKCLMEAQGPFYWFLLTKGIRTYRLLPLYFKKYYPSPKFETPDFERTLIEYLANLKFGNSYSGKDGVIRLDPPADRLKENFVSISENKLDDPYVQFFMKKNSGYVKGDELPCLARISLDNLTPISQRWLRLIEEYEQSELIIK